VDDPTQAPSAAVRACAWGGAAAFVLSLSVFLFSYDVTFGLTEAEASRPTPLLTNILLFSIFAGHHSFFARLGIRERIARTFPRLERSIYVWVASVLFIGVCTLWQPLPGIVWRVDNRVVAIALSVLHVIGIVVSVASAAAIDIWDLSGVRQIYASPNRQLSPEERSQEPNAESGEPVEFKTTGLYGLVRHPIYLGWFLLVFAVPAMTATRFAFAVISCVYVLMAIPFEERALMTSTRGAYDRYRQKVRFRLVPGIY
jgi:methanethiol S-methyltransferase